MKYLLVFILYFFTINDLHAFQNRENIYIKIQNNEPCLFIEDTTLTGKYDLTITGKNGVPMLYKFNQDISRDYPSKNNCKALNFNNFQNYQPLQDNEIYKSLLVTTDQPYRIFRSTFCLETLNGGKVLKEIRNNQCLTTNSLELEDQNIFNRLLESFKRLFGN